MNKDVFVKDIIQVTNGKLICGNENEICENYSKDTRNINVGDIYIGIKGESFDGNLFYEDALKKGAKGCLLQGVEIDNEVLNKYPDAFIIVVEDTILALQQIASYKRSLYNIPVIAITGSVGKTSTKDIVASVVSQKYKVLKTQGNYNNHIGVPLTILGLKDHTAAVVEMGMNNLGEISVLTNIAKPNIAIITNVGTAHIGNLGSRENILKAKLEIIEGLKENGTLIINNDNDMLNMWNKQNHNINVKTYAIQEKSDYMATNIVAHENDSKFDVEVENKKYTVQIPVGGEHFIYNSLCAITIGRMLNVEMNDIVVGIQNFELTKNRMEVIKSKSGALVINDAYNANYDSMKALIEHISKLKEEVKIAVLGDMLELGKYSEELHRKVGVEVAKNNISILITVGKEARYIANEAIKNGFDKNKVYSFESNIEAINKIKELSNDKTVILLKASNGMKFIDICKEII